MKRYIVAIAVFVSAVALITVGMSVAVLDNQEPTLSLALGSELPPVQGGTTARTGIRGIIEYTVRGPDGKIKEHDIIYNTVNVEGLNDTFNLITATGLGTHDGIAAMDVNVATDDPSDGVLSTSITLLLDGDSGTGGEQNPADGTVTTDFGTESGNGTVAVTFTATGAADIFQIVLTRSVEDDTLVGGAAAIADADIFAYVDVPDISLSASDTVTYTWTVDVD